MKKVMILGAGNHQLHLIEQAKKMGLYTIVVSPKGNYPGLSIADKVYYHDVKDMDAVLDAAKKEKIDGILSDQGDVFVKPVAYVAEKLGLSGIGYETAQLFTNKYSMREKCSEMGINNIKYKLVDDVESAVEFFNCLGNTAIIKPIDNGGSRGVSKVTSEVELRAKFDETKDYARSGGVIIEQYINGQEFEVDSIVVNGECRPMMYADLTEFSIPDVFACTTILFPAKGDPEIINKVLDLNDRIIKGFGLRQGLAHAEYIVDNNTGDVYLLEIAARGGGLYISSVVAEMQTGLNTAEFLIKLALGECKSLPEFKTPLCHCGYVAFYLPVGKVISLDGIDEAKSLPFVTKYLINLYKGMQTTSASDKRLRNVFFLKAETREQLEERIEIIRNVINVKVETADGIQGPIWR